MSVECDTARASRIVRISFLKMDGPFGYAGTGEEAVQGCAAIHTCVLYVTQRPRSPYRASARMSPSAELAAVGEPKCGVRQGRSSLEARITSVPYGLDQLSRTQSTPPPSSPLKPASKLPAWNLRASPRAMSIANPIRELIEKMGAPNPDKPVIALSQGTTNPNLGERARADLVGSHGRWKRPCLQTAHMTI